MTEDHTGDELRTFLSKYPGSDIEQDAEGQGPAFRKKLKKSDSGLSRDTLR